MKYSTSLKGVVSLAVLSTILSCSGPKTPDEVNNTSAHKTVEKQHSAAHIEGKPVVYQVFTRLFGNQNQTNKPWGTIEENGVGKFSDFSDVALQGIKSLGVSHVWYTGVPHHAVINDYTNIGLTLDDPDVVKGRAGSPYAVKDYYNVNPDLADDPANRLAEFEALIQRTHDNGMKVIIDIVPNHVARNYKSVSKPDGVEDFGESDDTSVVYARDNSFYYVVGEDFKVPEPEGGYQPLGGEAHPLADGIFVETPAKWTGNGSRLAQPKFGDWYETVKVNYGVKPDGSYDFPTLDDSYRSKDYKAHAAFWADKDVPASWGKFEHIVHYWLDKGVDGFRYDMAEMVPVEFWSYLNSSIKMKNPDAFILAEVYNPDLYRDYIQLGKMDYLYDKVEFYDSLKLVMQNRGNTSELASIQSRLSDIEHHMLHFLENHDEQRIASPDFAGDAQLGKPALVISALISRSPTMLYFGQDVGEDGSEEPGFGDPTRTSIFDYMGVPAHQRWMNGGKFDGGKLTEQEVSLRNYYQKVMTISAENPAMQGEYESLHEHNLEGGQWYNERLFSFVRWQGEEKLIVVINFDTEATFSGELSLPANVIERMAISNGAHNLSDLLSAGTSKLNVAAGEGRVQVSLAPLQSFVFSVE